MKITIKKDEIKFEAESIVDGMKVGILKEKFKRQGIPIKLGMGKGDDILDITINQKDLLDLLL